MESSYFQIPRSLLLPQLSIFCIVICATASVGLENIQLLLQSSHEPLSVSGQLPQHLSTCRQTPGTWLAYCSSSSHHPSTLFPGSFMHACFWEMLSPGFLMKRPVTIWKLWLFLADFIFPTHFSLSVHTLIQTGVTEQEYVGELN